LDSVFDLTVDESATPPRFDAVLLQPLLRKQSKEFQGVFERVNRETN
jgi:hypothetical protein